MGKLEHKTDPLLQSQFLSEDNHKKTAQFYTTVFTLVIFFLLQIVISSGNYSGVGAPPRFGDFEAQRHWMEITTNLPLKDWYINSPGNDLDYWGLDYPPLTAYHSWIIGKISELIEPKWTELQTSRGTENDGHKLFMRTSVILTLTFLYGPAALLIHNDLTKSRKLFKEWNLLACVCYPGLLFVDNGHFQYNHISLALFMLSVHFYINGKFILASILFSLALNFKQMELYHALPIFIFLLSKSFSRYDSIRMTLMRFTYNISKHAATVLAVFFVVWAPFILADTKLLFQIVKRIFPLNRGIYENRVANFWCIVSLVVKIKDILAVDVMAPCCALLTLISLLPSLTILFFSCTKKNFIVCLVISSLSFYLFSFQVHEKSILLAAIPALFLLYDENMCYFTSLFLFISQISMYPLCVTDEMPEILPLFITYYMFMEYLFYTQKDSKIVMVFNRMSVIISVFLCSVLLFFTAPTKYPYLFELLIALFCFAHFGLYWIYLNYWLLKLNSNLFYKKKSKVP